MHTATRTPGSAVRPASGRLHAGAAIVLAIGLALAVVTEGQLPGLWTKLILAAMIVPTISTALWLTGPRRDGATDERWAQPAL